MGTHPIFESDFDCLTEKKRNENRARDCSYLRDWSRIRRGQMRSKNVPTVQDAGDLENGCNATEDTYDRGYVRHVRGHVDRVLQRVLVAVEGLTEVSADDQTS